MAADALQLEVVTPDREVLRDSVAEVQLPASTGYIGILPGHTPLLTELGIGTVSFRKGTETACAVVVGGFAEILPDRVTILADSAERAEEIDVAAARAALKSAQDAQAKANSSGSSVESDAAQRYISAANARLEVAAHAGKTVTGGASASSH
jgi:F-type H+-transporting ATPase subunit epsilon